MLVLVLVKTTESIIRFIELINLTTEWINECRSYHRKYSETEATAGRCSIKSLFCIGT